MWISQAQTGKRRNLGVLAREIDADWHYTYRPELEYLDISENQVKVLNGLDRLPSIGFANFGMLSIYYQARDHRDEFHTDHNMIERVETLGTLNRLRCLRLSDNRLTTLDVRAFPNLRILYADRNRLSGLGHAERLTRLETLSLRYQSGKGLWVTCLEAGISG